MRRARLLEMLAAEQRVALLVRERFHTADGPVDIRRCNEADQYAVDALFGP